MFGEGLLVFQQKQLGDLLFEKTVSLVAQSGLDCREYSIVFLISLLHWIYLLTTKVQLYTSIPDQNSSFVLYRLCVLCWGKILIVNNQIIKWSPNQVCKVYIIFSINHGLSLRCSWKGAADSTDAEDWWKFDIRTTTCSVLLGENLLFVLPLVHQRVLMVYLPHVELMFNLCSGIISVVSQLLLTEQWASVNRSQSRQFYVFWDILQ